MVDPPPSSDPAPQPSRGLTILSRVAATPVTWLWPGRIPFGKLTIVDGDPGLGKSTALLDLAARLTTGRSMPADGDHPHPSIAPASVVLLSAEDGLADTIRPRLEAAAANLNLVLAVTHLPTDRGQRQPEIPFDVGRLQSIVERCRARLLIVDPLAAYLGPEVNPHQDHDVRRALTPLAQLAEQTGAATVVVRHLSKRLSRNPLYRGGGSIGFIGAARSALLIARDPDDPSGQRRLLASTKLNLGPPPTTLAYRLVQTPSGVASVVWDGPSHHTAATMLAQAELDQHLRTALEEAKLTLRAILGAGSLPADAVQHEARAAGLSRSTLHRAKAALGIRSRKSGYTWYWDLPDALRTPMPPIPRSSLRQAQDRL